MLRSLSRYLRSACSLPQSLNPFAGQQQKFSNTAVAKSAIVKRELYYPLRKCPKWVCVEDAVKAINTDHLVYIQGGAGTPFELIRALTEHGVCDNLRDVRVIHLSLEGDAPFSAPEFEKHFRSINFYIGSNVRDAVNDGRADYIPITFNDIPKMFYENTVLPDVALIHVSAPDERGFCSFGTNADITKAAASTAKVIIAQVNEHMPRNYGDTVIHFSHFNFAVRHDCPLPCISSAPPNDVELEIGKIIAERLIDDRATLQMGIGNIPDAVLCNLGNHKDLGIHTDIMSDGMTELAERGAITNKFKALNPGKIVAAQALGSRKLYEFIHDNPFVEMMGYNYTNSPTNIMRQPKMTAINSCIEMDITGQVCSDSLGSKMYSGFGGSFDFSRGAYIGLDKRGKAIIALPSTTASGESKIQPVIKLGGGVVSTRAQTQYVVTEHGVANLFGKTLRQRANALIQIAHPDHRECLEKAAFERFKCMPTKYL